MKRTDAIRISDTSVYSYATELIVELTGFDEDDDLVVLSYQFEHGEGSTVSPKQSVDPDHSSHVRRALTEAGYAWQRERD